MLIFGSFVLLVNMSVLVLVPYGYFYCYNFIIYLEVWNDNPSSLVLFPKDSLGY